MSRRAAEREREGSREGGREGGRRTNKKDKGWLFEKKNGTVLRSARRSANSAKSLLEVESTSSRHCCLSSGDSACGEEGEGGREGD